MNTMADGLPPPEIITDWTGKEEGAEHPQTCFQSPVYLARYMILMSSILV